MSGRDQRLAVTLALAWLGCGDASGTTGGGSSETSSSGTASETTLAPTSSETSSETSGTSETGELPESVERAVEVRLDGAPLPDAIVIQGGTGKFVLTDQDGRAQVDVDLTIPGDITLIASHELARSKAQTVDPYVDAPMVFELSTIAAGDNEQYVFNPPGEPGIEGTTLECGHCHAQLKAQWYDSPHRRSASNPIVHDIYAGTAANFADPSACTDAGGDWWIGKQPGSDQLAPRCYLGVGALPDLNPQCGQDQACDQLADTFGACADCHAPAIDGVLGGRDLLEAIGTSYEAGVHCDLCHKVESVDLAAPAGVGGRLHVHRPLEPTMSPGLGPWQPLAFGPYADVPNPRMGASPRELFMQAEFCAGCHQHDQAALVPGDTLDPTRWPDALLPVHSTYEEWRAGPLFAVAPCSSCHMPADPQAGNGADLLAEDIHLQGVARGWWRPPGAVRQHVWVGPRTPESGMLQLAAAIFIDKEIAGQSLIATVTVRNAGAGHAIPTGEPLRSLVLLVRARCGGQSLVATGGDAVPEFAGWLDRKLAPEDWSIWPGASVGDVVRVVADEGFVDYAGFGPFGDGTFDVAQKGLAKLRVVGQATITAVNGDVVTFDAPLPVGDIAYRGRPDPFEGDPQLAEPLAGAPGFAFARVLADASGNTMVPHHRAVDIVSDNRILPQTQWSSTHEFALACADPVVDALLVHRAYPVELARERGWAPVQQIMVEVSE